MAPGVARSPDALARRARRAKAHTPAQNRNNLYEEDREEKSLRLGVEEGSKGDHDQHPKGMITIGQRRAIVAGDAFMQGVSGDHDVIEKIILNPGSPAERAAARNQEGAGELEQ